ncbi:tail fiber domain-containing protein [bacterium]|nr:tail fiber domain-containing protein [bacterium]
MDNLPSSKKRILLLVCAFLLLFTIQVQAAIPENLNYQGKLKDNVGTPIADPTTIQFSIYNNISTGAPSDIPSSTGPLLWTETYDQVVGNCMQIDPDAEGIFGQRLGTCVSFPAYMDFTDEYYIGVKVGADGEATPRIPLSSNPYAHTAGGLFGDSEDVNIQTENSGNVVFNSAGNVQMTSNDVTPALIINQIGTGSLFEVQNNGTTSFVILNNGNVGVGVSVPTVSLHIADDMRLEGAFFDTSDDAGTAGQVLVSTVGGTDWVDSSTLAVDNIYTADGTLTGVRSIDGNGNHLWFNNLGAYGFYGTDAEIEYDGAILKLAASGAGQFEIGHQDSLFWYVTNTTSNFDIDVNNVDSIITDNRAITKGFEYAADYATGFTDRSLVDKEYVDDAITGGVVNIYNADGTLTGARTVNANGNSLHILNNWVTYEINEDTSAIIVDSGASRSRFDIEPSFFQMYAQNNATFQAAMVVGNNAGVLSLKGNTVGGGANETSLRLETGLMEIYTGDTSFQGATYDKDYSANFVDRSLVDKEYVDDHVGALTWQGALDNQVGGGNSFFMNMPSYEIDDDGGSVKYEVKAGRDFSFDAPNFSFHLDDSTNSFRFTDDRVGAAQVGVVYSGDYSANFADRSLVDKGYVDVQVSSASPWERDSVNGYIYQKVLTDNIGIGNVTPRVALDIGNGAMGGDGAILATGEYGSGWIEPNLGAGTRMMWYPRKAAFRAGHVEDDQWDDANIGDFSVAFGLDSIASGDYSFAAGEETVASGTVSVAIGSGASSTSFGAIAIGSQARGLGIEAVGIGSGARGSGDYALALGMNPWAVGNYSIAMGRSAYADGDYSIAMGHRINTNADYVVAIGLDNMMGLQCNQANSMCIMGGEVGMGTIAPSTILHVDSNVVNTAAILTLENTAGDFQVFRTDATPESSVTGSIGDLAVDGSSGEMYIKNSGTGTNIGWVQVATSATTSNIYTDDGTISENRLISGTGGNQVEFNMTDGLIDSGIVYNHVSNLLYHDPGGPANRVSLEVGDNITITDLLSSRGALYAADYSAHFIDRSLVDKGYVDVQVSSASPWERDSVNGYIYQKVLTDNIGIGNVTPRVALDIGNGAMGGDGAILATGELGSGWVEPNLGAGTRMMWYPRKAAFRAGYVDDDHWDDANIGEYSVAFGLDNIASGDYSFVAGEESVASGSTSVAIGGGAFATESNTVAIGGGAYATDVGATALGFHSDAQGSYSVALGWGIANGDYSVAMGTSVTAVGEHAIAIGNVARAAGNHSIAMGHRITADADYVVAIGLDDMATLQCNQANSMCIMGGEVGMGTIAPSSILHIDSNAANTAAILTLENTAGDFQVFRTDATPESSVTGSIGDLAVDGSSGEMYIKNSGSGTNTGWLSFATGSGASTFLALTDTPAAYTAGSLLFTSGSEVVEDNANLFWNDTTNRLGIGTTTPGEVLEVSGNIHINTGQMLISPIDAWENPLQVYESAGGDVAVSIQVNGNSENSLNIKDNNVNTVKINGNGDTYFNGGNIGIGILTPSTILHIDSNAVNTSAILTLENTAGDFQIFRTDATPESSVTGSIGDLAIDGTGGDMYIKHTGSGTNTGWLAFATGSGSGTLDQAYDSGGAGVGRQITADTGAVEITVSDTSNNVGLVVNQNDTTNNPNGVQINHSGTGYGLYITEDEVNTDNVIARFSNTQAATASGNYLLVDTDGHGIVIGGTNALAGGRGTMASVDFNTSTYSQLVQQGSDYVFQTGGAFGALQNSLTIANDGNAVFSTDSDSTTNAYQFTNLGSGNSLVVNDQSADTTPFIINAHGQVGVGTNAPHSNTMIHVLAGASGATPVAHSYITIENSNESYLSLLTTNTGSGRIVFGDPENNLIGQVGYDHGTDSMFFRVNNAYRLNISSAGAVQFNGAYTFPTTDGTSGQVLQTDGTGALSWATAGGSDTDWTGAGTGTMYATNTSDDVLIGSTTQTGISGRNLYIEGDGSAGAVHIRGSSPRSEWYATSNTSGSRAFDIVAYSDAIHLRILDDGFSTANDILTASLSEIVFNESSTDQDFRIESDDNTDMFFVDAGNDRVGIGTNSPTSQLHVYDALNMGYTGITIENGGTTNNDTRVQFISGTKESDIIKSAFSGDLSFRNGGIIRMAIGESGVVRFNNTYSFPTVDGANGEVLQTDGSGTLTWASVGGVAVWTKTGTNLSPTTSGDDLLLNTGETLSLVDMATGSMPFFGASGLLSQDNANLFWNDTNNRLGIGTSSPIHKFQISGDHDEARILIHDSDGGNDDEAGLLFAVSGNLGTSPAKGGIFFNRTDTYGRGDLIFATDNNADSTEVAKGDIRMSIKSRGEVIVGDATPTHIFGSGSLYVDQYIEIGKSLYVGSQIVRRTDLDTYIDFEDEDSLEIRAGGVRMLSLIEGVSDSVVINEYSLDVDFRIEGDTEANLLFVDASTDNVGINTNTPRTSLELSGDGSVLATGALVSGWTEPNLGSGVRMMWYPRKAAFRAGDVDGTQWNDANIGSWSVATGQSTRATASVSTAFGSYTLASDLYTTAMGAHTTASNDYATAMGRATTASGQISTAMGFDTTASATGATATGYSTTASGLYGFTIGNSITAGPNSHIVAIGLDATPRTCNQTSSMCVMGGNVGIGALAPVSILELESSGDTVLTIDTGLNNDAEINLSESGTVKWNIFNDGNNSDRLYITDDDDDNGVYIAQDATSWTSNSDIRLKENVDTIDNALESVLGMRGVRYNFIGTDNTEIGVIAQEVEGYFPEIVDTNGEYWGVSYARIGAILIEAIKEQQIEIETLGDLSENEEFVALVEQVDSHDSDIDMLKSENDAMKEALCGLGVEVFCE